MTPYTERQQAGHYEPKKPKGKKQEKAQTSGRSKGESAVQSVNDE